MIDAMSGKPPAFPKRQWVLKAEWLIIEISLKSSLSSRRRLPQRSPHRRASLIAELH
jgi:hypothetical protein